MGREWQGANELKTARLKWGMPLDGQNRVGRKCDACMRHFLVTLKQETFAVACYQIVSTTAACQIRSSAVTRAIPSTIAVDAMTRSAGSFG